MVAPSRLRVALALALVALLAEPALAHAGALAGAAATGSAPLWFVLLTGGAIVGGSFLFATLLTDHEAIRAVNARRVSVAVPRGLREGASTVLGAGSVLALALVVVLAFVGPAHPESNAAVLFVWAVWWAGYAMSVYAVADTWSVVNPWRRLTALVPSGDRTLPARVGDWPAVAGLLGLVWLEVVSPVASDPRLLGLVVVGYTAVTLVGVALYGPGTWFDRVDPIARVFRTFGRVAPIQRTAGGLSLGAPGAELSLPRADTARRSAVAADGVGSVATATAGPVADESRFVVALLWATTFDGFVSTPAWAAIAGAGVGAGVPALALYLLVIVAGYALFLAAYRAASRRSRASADTLVTADYLALWFAPALVPIAAGYHVAHFLGYFVRLGPQVLAVLSDPLATTGLVGLPTLPSWFSLLQLTLVLGGHLFAIWVAHGRSFELFPGRLQPIRSQYPFTVVMIVYTMTSMWIVAQPYTPPPYV